jgi:ketosteroid isomerase-like protein
MSEKPTALSPVELTRRAYETFSRRDRDLDVVMRDYDDDSVFDMSSAGLGSFQGVAAIRSFLEDWIGAYEEYEVEPEQVLDLGSGVVLAVARQKARLAHGTGSIQMHHGNVFVWEEGVIALLTHYNDPDQARAAAERLAEERG